jgi:enoyl-CoA hydratase/carnithine racemase
MDEPKGTGLTLHVDKGVATLAIDYPPFNLVSGPLIGDLARMQERIAGDESIGVVILQSALPGVFCLHGDVTGVGSMVRFMQQGGGLAAAKPRMAPLHGILGRFATMPQIVIAKIAGLCRGGGQEIALACDMRFAAKGVTRMGQPEVAMGIIPGAGGATRLPHLIGKARALEVLVGSADLSAEDAERLGIINRALPADELDTYVDNLARHIADQPRYAVAAVKRVVQAAFPPLDFDPEIEGSATAMGHADTPLYVEGMLAAGMQRSLEHEWNIDAVTAEGRRLARARQP